VASAGERVVGAGGGSWAVADVTWPVEVPVPEEGAQQLLRAFLDSPGGGFTVERHLVFDTSLVRAGPAVASSPW
jgi:hypothetical protein